MIRWIQDTARRQDAPDSASLLTPGAWTHQNHEGGSQMIRIRRWPAGWVKPPGRPPRGVPVTSTDEPAPTAVHKTDRLRARLLEFVPRRQTDNAVGLLNAATWLDRHARGRGQPRAGGGGARCRSRTFRGDDHASDGRSSAHYGCARRGDGNPRVRRARAGDRLHGAAHVGRAVCGHRGAGRR